MNSFLTERARKAAYRNRSRFNQSEMQIAAEFQDKNGQKYVRYTNGMIVTQTNAILRASLRNFGV
jgi:uncharacterized beta-barrel protein YwiB (DUF1934 family)